MRTFNLHNQKPIKRLMKTFRIRYKGAAGYLQTATVIGVDKISATESFLSQHGDGSVEIVEVREW